MSDFSKPGHRAFALTVFLAVVAGQCPEPLSACSCAGPPPPPMEALAQSDHVFHGTVVSIDTSDPASHFVRFETHAVWKGSAEEELEVRTASSSAACGVLFVPGLDYVVYAYDTTQDGVTTTNSCWRTRTHSPEEAAALGEPIATFPGEPACEPTFRRADFNGDASVDISDGIAELTFLFVNGNSPGCEDAADSNDDGTLDIADAIYIFQYLFNGGVAPPAPGAADCGADLTKDALGCESYDGCPGAVAPGGDCISGDCCPPGYYCAKDPGTCDGPGVCTALPERCTLELNRVCGCDGVTYANPCIAASAGANIDHMGACEDDPPPVDGCTTNDDCDIESYCSTEDGECDEVGECRPRPEICIALFDPVCGCDGQTYSNSCVAASRGVSVDHVGECENEPQGCKDNGDCPRGTYCRSEEGECDEVGECVDRPDACARIFDPVCGCDGQTYSNACVAASNGISVDYAGECRVEPPAGCETNRDCDAIEYCAKGPASCDGVGECAARPRACPRIFDPVCGCDGVTYSNSCVAASSGVNVDYAGECRVEPPPPAGCETNRDCDAVSYCNKDTGDCDGVGECVALPRFCTREFRPVCGCDGVTYSNACVAASNGVSIDHVGACEEPPEEGCRTNRDCDAVSYCAKDPSDCDGIGECRERPMFCPFNFDPVCGCDGRTYGNACAAAAEGVNISSEGECPVRPIGPPVPVPPREPIGPVPNPRE